jgi:hypothetical protein
MVYSGKKLLLSVAADGSALAASELELVRRIFSQSRSDRRRENPRVFQ